MHETAQHGVRVMLSLQEPFTPMKRKATPDEATKAHRQAAAVTVYEWMQAGVMCAAV